MVMIKQNLKKVVIFQEKNNYMVLIIFKKVI